jgi:hypothetical protein
MSAIRLYLFLVFWAAMTIGMAFLMTGWMEAYFR